MNAPHRDVWPMDSCESHATENLRSPLIAKLHTGFKYKHWKIYRQYRENIK